jgi:hypothetical protein
MTNINYQDKNQKTLSINFDILEEEELAAMANDPDIQAEIAAMNQEFAVTEMDGVENL